MISEQFRKMCTVKVNGGGGRRREWGGGELLSTTWEAVPRLWGTV